MFLGSVASVVWVWRVWVWGLEGLGPGLGLEGLGLGLALSPEWAWSGCQAQARLTRAQAKLLSFFSSFFPFAAGMRTGTFALSFPA